MNDQAVERDLDWARRCIFVAFLPPSESSQVAELATEYRVPADHYRSRNSLERVEDLGEDCDGKPRRPAQIINRDLFQVKGRDSARRGSSKPPVDLRQLEYAFLVHRVAKLPPEQVAWVHYAYTRDCVWEYEEAIAIAVWDQLVERLAPIMPGNRLPKVMQGLTYLVLQDCRRRCNTGKALHSNEKLQKLTGIGGSNWSRDWTPRIKVIREIIREIDHLALRAVLDVLSQDSADEVA